MTVPLTVSSPSCTASMLAARTAQREPLPVGWQSRIVTSVRNPLFARLFSKISVADDERSGVADLRRELLAGLTGRVVEMGAGSGLNFPHYPAGVRELVAVEPEPYLRAQADTAAARAPVAVTVVDGVAEDIPAADGSFDAAVVAGLLCSVADPLAALHELRRVLRPGGELRFFEHVRSEHPVHGAIQDAVRPIWARVMGGCQLNRRSGATIAAAGFTIVYSRDVTVMSAPHEWFIRPRIIGRAVA